MVMALDTLQYQLISKVDLLQIDDPYVILDSCDLLEKVYVFFKEEYELFASNNGKLVELIISHKDKSLCFEISSVNIKCVLTWANIELDHYGCAQVENYLDGGIWKWLWTT